MKNTAQETDNTLRALAEAIQEERQRLGLTQQDLAVRASVSSRTISLIESLSKNAVRSDVVIRLATALGQDIRTWLDMANATATDPTIQIHKRRVESNLELQGGGMQGGRSYNEISRDELILDLEGLAEDIGIFCVYYTSIPGLLTRHHDLLDKIRVHIENGLYLAMFIPYSPVPEERTGEKWNLAHFYEEVGGEVIRLAWNLRARLSDTAKHRVRVFRPKLDADGVVPQFAIPPSTCLQSRPMISKSGRDNLEFMEDKGYELYEWVTSVDGAFDRIYKFITHTGPTTGNFLWNWREFFRDVIEPWCDSPEGEWGRQPEQSIWKQVEVK